MGSGEITSTVLTRRPRRSFARSTRALVVAAVSLVSAATTWGQGQPGILGAKSTNHPPTVKIVSPKADATYEENAQVRYEIDVSDKEDGESKFQEINSTEVLLIVRHFSNPVAAEDAMNRAIADDAPGLGTLRTSDCLNCHAFDARLIGPSFADIRKRYPYSPANIDSLSRHILQGASGAWGSIKMPSHPDLTAEQAAACVSWILKTAADPETSYYTGTEGSFRATVPPDAKAKDKGVLVLIASYTDHGSKDDPSQRMQGHDAIRVRIR
jgi:cytochrome c